MSQKKAKELRKKFEGESGFEKKYRETAIYKDSYKKFKKNNQKQQ